MEHLIALDNVSKRFERFMLNDIHLDLPKGFIMGLIGANGAGKTTTLKLILKNLEADSGTIQVFGESQLTPCFREKIGVVMDQLIFPDDWVAKDVAATMKGFYRRFDGQVFQNYLDRFDLDAKKKLKDYSRGMALKIMLAAALSHDAELLILDEPTSGLDAITRDELMGILQEYIKDGQRGVLFSTHITKDLETIADYITFLDEGQLIYTGPKDELLEKYCMVKGPLLDKDLKEKVIGLTESGYGYDGLILREDLKHFPKDTVVENSTLDDLLVRIHKGGMA